MFLSAATIFVAAFGLSGCTHSDSSTVSPSAPPPTTVSVAAPPVAPLPDPAALTDVLAKLSDPAIPGNTKLALVEGSTPGEAAALDNFAKALADSRMLPLTFTAIELAWSEPDPGNVSATVKITSAKPGSAPFTFPMEFKPAPPGWQLSRGTADQLLEFGNRPR